jgi:hypothetical protein
VKLENVKILDMVNGEPTRVEYNGVIYEKTNGNAKSGDLVRAVDDVCITDVTEGGFYEIYTDEHGDLVFDDDIGDDRDYDVWTDELETFRKVPDQPQPDLVERIAELERRIAALEGREKADNEPKFEVGDYVKVVGGISCHIGKIAKIECIFDGRAEFSEVINDNQHPISGSPLEYLVKLTAEEVAQVKEEIRWAKIGRKPGEFKKGDIVRVIEYDGFLYNGHEYGLIGEVEYDETINDPKVDGGVSVVINGRSLFNYVELICPVEHRFDREGANV